MIFKKFADLKLSSLGMGCMRLPTKGSNSEIDIDASREMIAYAMKNGVNYYDTAWGYHGGQSEIVMGELLKEYPRDSFYLASKFPGYDLSNMGKVEEIFEKQLEKCQVDYFDFYLFHSVSEGNIDAYLDRSNRIYEYLCEQKKNGRIRHIGFSTHGTLETVKRFLDAYGDVIEFCQIQLNWLDWDYQKANEKVRLMNELNIPIWVMEPVRGGGLCRLAPKYADKLHAIAPERTFAEWAFRYLQMIDGVTVTLSGMSDFEQLKQNIHTFSDYKPLTDEEIAALYDIAYEMTHRKSVPCTACRYCTDHCPMELDIPWLIELYNEHSYSSGGYIATKALEDVDDAKKPSACIGCHACEAVCPQNIKITDMMQDFTSKLRR